MGGGGDLEVYTFSVAGAAVMQKLRYKLRTYQRMGCFFQFVRAETG